MDLKNVFHTCVCGQDLQFDEIEQVRTCPTCQRTVSLPAGMKTYLAETYGSAVDKEKYPGVLEYVAAG